MLPSVTTWGELRADYLEDVKNGVINSENPLHDATIRDASTDKSNEDLVWPALTEEAAPIVAAGAEEEVEEEPELPSPLYFTVDDKGNVLELVKMEDTGLFIRMDNQWIDISDEDEFPTVYEQIMKFANEDSVPAWDAGLEENDELKLEDITDYIIE